LGFLAEFASQRGDIARAVALVRESVTLAHELRNVPNLLYAFATLAGLEAAEGRSRRAATLWGAIETIEETGEATLDPTERATYEEQVLAQRDADFEAAREAGRALSLAEAVSFALRD
jgi:hypothetical protein